MQEYKSVFNIKGTNEKKLQLAFSDKETASKDAPLIF